MTMSTGTGSFKPHIDGMGKQSFHISKKFQRVCCRTASPICDWDCKLIVEQDSFVVHDDLDLIPVTDTDRCDEDQNGE